ncbi:hypothetical protein [Cryptosporangium phraense]|uniref:Uncharacterized protein n=1 Tax=Cryptosporangium phraense TaxID=2593070 RepID=A0A545AJL6_9ACTN|nr:hypothetical protein [Cryptosporangium phraense]TQS41489.1 hypothetical protein FL583_29770 [Cryptosporangium phraense]
MKPYRAVTDREGGLSGRRLVVAALLLLFPLFAPAAPARAAEATMTFTGALDVAGLLSSLTVQPRAVTVPAGGEVAFVNGTTVALKVTVGGETARLEPGGSRTMLFTGSDRTETFAASASAVRLPLVGPLTSAAGQVSVLAIPVAAAEPMMSTRPSSSPSPPADEDEPTSEASGAVVPLGSPEPRASDPSAGVSPSQRTGEASQAASSAASQEASSAASRGDSPEASRRDPQGERAGRAERAARPPVLPPFPGFRSAHDQLGLIVLLSAIVLAGLGAMAFRTVLAHRPVVEVGAHSQAARKARVLRRRRG